MSRLDRIRRRSSNKLFTILILFAIIPFIMFAAKFFFSPVKKDPPRIISAVTIVPTATAEPTPTPILSRTSSSSSLADAVKSALAGTHGTYGVVVRNLKTGESFAQNGHSPFESGSLYKLWVMGQTYAKIKSGALSEDQILSRDVVDLNDEFDIDPEGAEKTDGTEEGAISDLLYNMITISDNYSALLLTDKIGLSSIASFLSLNGFSESKVGTNGGAPTTTPSDIALFFEKLYDGSLADDTYTAKMLDLLKQQKLNDKLPKYLPDGVIVAHKTGELEDFTHDAGIVYSTNGDYIIVVLSESDFPALANARIANISKAVYNYFVPGS